MMNIVVKSVRGYLFMSVVICGQVKRKMLSGSISSRIFASRVLHQLTQAELLIEKQTPRTKMVRLNMPQAKEVLQHLGALEEYYYDQTENHNFKMSPPRTGKKKERLSAISLQCLKEGIGVNGIHLTMADRKTKSTETGQSILSKIKDGNKKLDTHGNPIAETETEREAIAILRDVEIYENGYAVQTSYADRMKTVTPKEKCFYQATEVKCHTIRNENESMPTLNINTSKSYGHLYGEYNSYAVYCMTSAKEKYADSVERRYRNYLENNYLLVYGAERYDMRRSASPKGEAILFYDNQETIMELIHAQSKPKLERITPIEIYSKCYGIDINNGGIADYLETDWQKKLLRRLFSINEISAVQAELFPWCDAIVDGNPAIELISMDIAKITETRKLLKLNKSNRLNVVCKKENEAFIKRAYEGVLDQIQMKAIDESV